MRRCHCCGHNIGAMETRCWICGAKLRRLRARFVAMVSLAAGLVLAWATLMLL